MLFKKYMKQYGACKGVPMKKTEEDKPPSIDYDKKKSTLNQKGKSFFEMDNSSSIVNPDNRSQSPYKNHPKVDWTDYSIVGKNHLRAKSIDTLAETNLITNKSQKAKLFVVKIEVRKGVVNMLRFNEQNNPYAASQNFCFQNGLDDSAIDAIASFLATIKNGELGRAFNNRTWK